jgi:hypothetical protein
MSTGMKFAKFAGMVVLCLGNLSLMHADSVHTQRKTTKKVQPPPPLPSGPTGPVQQIPLDSIAPVPPQVSFQHGQLTIVAPNSTLGDILKAVRKQTGAEIEIPPATERVVTHLGPGPVREVVADLLNGSRFNYVLLGSADDSSLLTRVVLVAKSPDTGNPNTMQAGQPGTMQAGNVAAAPPEDMADAAEADATDDAAEDNADQSATEAEQPAAPADQQGVKTPQQMLQEMQQRQLQLQQQQQQSQGQTPAPVPPPPPGRAPQEQ